MGRSNTPASIENWIRLGRDMPFRASISSSCYWDVGRPPPYLIAASKVCRGGRMLLAFPLAETRDYFVEGHTDQGAQVEDDFCKVASPRRNQGPKPRMSPDYETARIEVGEALRAYKIAGDRIGEVFLPDVIRLLAGDRPREAMALARSMPVDSVEKAIAMTRISESGKYDPGKHATGGIEPTAYDARRASAMYEWQKAHNSMERLEEPFAAMAFKKARQVLAEEGHDALLEMIDEVPPVVSKVHLVMFARKNAPAAAPATNLAPRF
jgi:hypothetical protein|nr:hypothetical protein [Neorhizobium tomejilense]